MPRKAKGPKKEKKFYLQGWLINGLRSLCRRYPPYYQVRNAVKETYYITTKAGKPLKRVSYQCQLCKNKVSSKEIRVDHIDPVVPIEGFPRLPSGEADWNIYVARLFCDPSNLQAICVGCHDVKSAKEAEQRALVKKNKSE